MQLPTALVRASVTIASRRIFDTRVGVAQQRRRFEHSVRLSPPPRGASMTTGSIAGVPCTTVTCGVPVAGRTVLLLHGGGFAVGSARTHRPFAARLAAATRAAVILPDYRLAPEHPHPAATQDCLAVWRELTANPSIDLVVAGDSAGGNLALQVALTARDAGSLPRALVLIAPAVDLANDRFGDPGPEVREIVLNETWSRWAVGAYCADHDRTVPALSPINADLAGLPAMLIVAAREEILLDDADRLSKAARAAGIEVHDVRASGMWHDYPLQAGVCAEASHALARIAAFITTAYAVPRPPPHDAGDAT